MTFHRLLDFILRPVGLFQQQRRFFKITNNMQLATNYWLYFQSISGMYYLTFQLLSQIDTSHRKI